MGIVRWIRAPAARLRQLETTKAQIIQASLLILILFLVGMYGFHFLEGWSLMDSLYMTFITLTTIGFAEVNPLSTTGRIFTMFIGTVGILTLGFIVTRTTQLLVSRSELQTRQMQRTIDTLKDHYVLCGYGRIGERIAYNLEQASTPFVVIDNDPEQIKRLQERGYLYVEGDAEEEATLLEAGLTRAKGVIAALSADADNVFVTLMARELNPSLFILARANTGSSIRKIRRAGADKVVSPYELGADRMAQFVLRPKVNQFLEHALHVGSMDLTIDEVVIRPGSPIAGKTLRASNLREGYGAIVVATVREDGQQIDYNPTSDRVITPGQTLILLGPRDRLQELQQQESTS